MDNNLKVIFWNTNKQDCIEQIADICNSESPDIFLLSESNENLLSDDNLQLLDDIDYMRILNPGCDRVDVLAKENIEIQLDLQNKFFTILYLETFETYLIGVHFPSEYHRHAEQLKEYFKGFRNKIDEQIGLPNENKILIIGDFNVSPYEEAMINFNTLSAGNSIFSRSQITRDRITKTTYYNPTWQLFANVNFPGSTHFARPSGYSYDILEHHFLDQVIISHNLKENSENNEIKFINESQNFNYYNLGNNTLEYSDHLPLYYKLKIN